MGLKAGLQILQQTGKIANRQMNNTTQVIAQRSSIMDDFLKIEGSLLDSILMTQAKNRQGVFKGLPNSCTNSELNDLKKMFKIEKLYGQFPTETTKLKLNGIEKDVLFFKGSQGGSNTGAWVLNPNTGNLGYVKFGKIADCSYSEKIASDLYHLAGAKTPPMSIITEGNNIGTLSKYIPIEEVRSEHIKLLREDFGADCWLANWDALKHGNVGIYNGQAVRMDVGGALRYGAQGAHKGSNFGEDVKELTTFFDNYSLSKPYLKDMTREELIKSLKKVAEIKDSDIAKVIKKQVSYREEYYHINGSIIPGSRMRHSGVIGPEFLHETLVARKNYIAQFLEKCEKSPQQEGETIEMYVRRIADEMPKTEYKIPYDKLKLSSRVGHGRSYTNLTMSETLTPSQKKIYEEAYNAYRTSKTKHILNPNANEVLTTDCMVHATNIDALDDILKRGITSCELRPNIKNATGEGTRTTLSGDFWDIKSTMSIKDYFTRSPQKCADGELNFLYNKTENPHGGSITIVINKQSVDKDIMKHSFVATDKTSPSAKILRSDDNILPWNYPTHRIVPFGVPANTIDRIIIRENIPDFNDVMQSIIKKIKNSGLDIKLYDTKGKLLWEQPKKIVEVMKNYRFS